MLVDDPQQLQHFVALVGLVLALKLPSQLVQCLVPARRQQDVERALSYDGGHDATVRGGQR